MVLWVIRSPRRDIQKGFLFGVGIGIGIGIGIGEENGDDFRI
ncbi:hypothetical protein D3OALGA1CA_334 [Olavius algarvensis associated proteobacterium Delta 3]|nr:hypothetical protein D3OALGA1CA_334 [Olavius algarvensis associated proteobacterium Delta 3]CAB5097787.1 hypothetical protein D3OALGB2SA_1625 [Olavius algarvensis associated proteobacterium Delta 3]